MSFERSSRASRADQTTVRRANLGVVLAHVAEHGPCTRARVAAETGLTRGTVSSLVAELIDLQVLREAGEVAPTGGVGRPGVTLELADAVGALGLEVNVDYLHVYVEDLTGAVRYEDRVYGDHRGSCPGPVLDELASLSNDAIDEIEATGLRVVGVTLALPGLVRADTGTLLNAPNLGWTDVPVAAELESRLGGRSVRVDNEANLAAVAEHVRGAAIGCRDFICVFGEVGIGAGIFLGGRLFRGTRGFGGELGHFTVDPAGAPCACGSRGCLETVVGQEAIARQVGIELSPGGRTRSVTEELVRRALERDDAVRRSLADAARTLGTALASAVNLFDVGAVVLGGCFGPLAPWLLDGVRDALEEHVLSWRARPVEVYASTLGEGAPVRGAAAESLRQVLVAPWSALGGEPLAVTTGAGTSR
jgi:predicted NBD/HSP70 family sugar kinase